jgi:hypothetical protein
MRGLVVGIIDTDRLPGTMMLVLERGKDFGTGGESIAAGMTCLIYP